MFAENDGGRKLELCPLSIRLEVKNVWVCGKDDYLAVKLALEFVLAG